MSFLTGIQISLYQYSYNVQSDLPRINMTFYALGISLPLLDGSSNLFVFAI